MGRNRHHPCLLTCCLLSGFDDGRLHSVQPEVLLQFILSQLLEWPDSRLVSSEALSEESFQDGRDVSFSSARHSSDGLFDGRHG
jgi:hypothetical protein